MVQALSRHVSASHGFSVPTIWLPEKTGAASVSNGETNELPLLLDLMKKTLRVKVWVCGGGGHPPLLWCCYLPVGAVVCL
jgi:hypothetical protein